MNRFLPRWAVLLSLLTLVISLFAQPLATTAQKAPLTTDYAPATSDSVAPSSTPSHRLIIELQSPALAAWSKSTNKARNANQRLDLKAADAQTYLAQLEAEQNRFVTDMRQALPGASVESFVNEFGNLDELRYSVVFNGMTVNVGNAKRDDARKVLEALPNVKGVYLDLPQHADLHVSNTLIGSPALWDSAGIGGRDNAGAGIKIASMDGGVHKDGAMFSGTGYSYPAGYPANGLGLTQNNNGKIIASRTYFRTWDGAAAGDQNPWPGENGTPHGVHTAGIAAGDVVTATFGGLNLPLTSGVAPKAWVMSYRVFYASVNGIGSFYNAEGIAALEDIVADEADVVNNSWGGGPGSIGGEFDALDTALINTSNAGIFVSMSAGNAGPNKGTSDHPSDEYIVVAASTTQATFAAGQLNVTQPTPISPTLQTIPIAAASFGGPINAVVSNNYLPASVISPTNALGCSPFGPTSFTGKIALIQRGTCEFGVKALNAQNAGASFVIIYNNAANGNTLINMGAGAVGAQVTIPAIMIGFTQGSGLVNWYSQHGAASVAEINPSTYLAPSTADVIAGFSSRGPGVGDVLKPDVTAPGVNILSHGYTPGASGEARHLGYGTASGTSMAAPHVAGAAALLRQAHPSWTNDQIKSALMSTSKYIGVTVADGSPAQPLDMGAGRIDLSKASDPGVFLSPPSLSFGQVLTGTTKAIQVSVSNATNVAETYNLSTQYTGGGFSNITAMAGVTLSTNSITVPANGSAQFTVTFNSLAGRGYGDNQGFIVLDGPNHDAHMPAWARVTKPVSNIDVLVIDNDGSSSLGGAYIDVTRYYTETLEAMDLSYQVLDVDDLAGSVTTFLPPAEELYPYKAIIYFTGNYNRRNGEFTIATPLTALDMDRLTEYANNGGTIIAMGQNLAQVLNSTSSNTASFFYSSVLSGEYVRANINSSNVMTVTSLITATTQAPQVFQNMEIDIDASETAGGGARNQTSVDALESLYGTDFDPNRDPLIRSLFSIEGEEDVAAGRLHRAQPSLETPGISYLGRTIYTTFGLEGVNNLSDTTGRQELIQTFFRVLWDDPTSEVIVMPRASQVWFDVDLTSEYEAVPVEYRWDFGDGSAYVTAPAGTLVAHTYATPGQVHTVRVEVTDSYGNKSIATRQVTAPWGLYLPMVTKN
ncbi:S8 family serine peptidase [Herpetosiphon gulosus]|uniref:PKD domain-containing protein n=1 Tax=Herpetosiphon gulosus TaxID=1973496 RepID=A0ABP9WZG3_9CHLR